MRRALALYVEDKRALIIQAHALHLSWKHIQAHDTDLVFFGPAQALDKLPDDVVKVEQSPASRLPCWNKYHFINSITCLNAEGSNVLLNYDYILRSDLDVFLTPAWHTFQPTEYTCGKGLYVHTDNVRQKIPEIARRFNLSHRGIYNIGATHYGPTELVRNVSLLTEVLCRYLIQVEFRDSPGKWPDWYHGVSSMYASEIAVNHLIPQFCHTTDKLDAFSWLDEPADTYPHIHCWHGDKMFSKQAFLRGDYDELSLDPQDLTTVPRYALNFSRRALKHLQETNLLINC